MSYIDTPRLHILGGFYTDPSSVNNDPQHYDPKNGPPSPWQIPSGRHYFQWKNCQVVNVLDDAGGPTSDPAVGAAFTSTDLFATPPMGTGNATTYASPARLVDLDVYQQGVSTIYGLQICIAFGNDSIIGDVTPAPALNSSWFNHTIPTRAWGDSSQQASYGDDADAVGVFQTRIRVAAKNWNTASSPALEALRQRTQFDGTYYYLSFKFVLDSYLNNFFGAPIDTAYTGRMVGTIGPVLDSGEPIQTLGARWLKARMAPDDACFTKSETNPQPPPTPPWYYPKFYGAPFKVDVRRNKLVLDLAGALAMQSIAVRGADGTWTGGSPADLGTLTAVIVPDGAPEVILGAVNYQAAQYANYAGIVELPLTPEQAELLATAPLRLRTSRADIIDPSPAGAADVLAEDPSGLWFAIDQRTFRLADDHPASRKVTTNVFATRFGQPAQNVVFGVEVIPVKGTTPGATVPPSNPGDTPSADGKLLASITPSNSAGVATLTIQTNGDPKSRTVWLDSQLYFVNVYYYSPWGATMQIQEQQVSVLAFAAYPPNPAPAWEDVRKMMEPYDTLYPVMRSTNLRLIDEHSFVIFSWNPPWTRYYGFPADYKDPIIGELQNGAIPMYLSREIEDPRYMPVSRDLSPNKIITIFNFIKNLPPATS